MNKFLWVILSGIGMGLCPAPFLQWWWAWVALVPLWRSLIGQKLPQAFLLGGLWGFFYHGCALFWLTGVHPLTWLGVSWGVSLTIAVFVWLIVVAWGALLAGLWATGLAMVSSIAGWRRIVIGVGLFCGLEKLWSWSPLYWTALGYTQSPGNLVVLQLGRIAGQQTVTAAIVLVNGCLAEIIGNADWRVLGMLVSVLLSTIGYGSWYLMTPLINSGSPVTIGIIQGNISNPVKFSQIGKTLSLQRYREGYQKLAASGVEMVVTPEGALPFASERLYESFADLLRKYNVPIWLGGVGSTDRGGDQDSTNSLFLWDGAPVSWVRYDKVRLVPIGEYVPFRRALGGLIRRLSPLEGEYVPGNSNQEITTPWGKFVMGICYESAYPEHFRKQARSGGELIITASNNAHYAPSMPAQHHAQDVARAIETDRYAVRATNTGYSGIVDPIGRTLWISNINTYETHGHQVFRRQTQTLYVRWGDWLTIIFVVVSIGLVGNEFLLKSANN